MGEIAKTYNTNHTKNGFAYFWVIRSTRIPKANIFIQYYKKIMSIFLKNS